LLKFTLKLFPINRPAFRRFEFVNRYRLLRWLALVTRNEYHIPESAVISATRLHPATAEDSIENCDALIRLGETEKPEYEEDKSKICPDGALVIESS